MSNLVTGDAVVLDVRHAGFASRLVALLLDLLVQFVAGLVLILITLNWIAPGLDEAAASAVGLTLSVLIVVGYPTTFETVSRGKSLGKLAMGLRVVGDDGSPERFRQALLRALAAVPEIYLLMGAPALITSLLNERSKRLGDIFAGTVVVQERVPVHAGAMTPMPPGLEGWAASLELSRLPDQVAVTARQYMSRYHELAREAREEMGRRIATNVAEYVSPPPPPHLPPHVYIAAVLSERRRREEARMGVQQPWPAPSTYPTAAYPAPAYGQQPGYGAPSGYGAPPAGPTPPGGYGAPSPQNYPPPQGPPVPNLPPPGQHVPPSGVEGRDLFASPSAPDPGSPAPGRTEPERDGGQDRDEPGGGFHPPA